MTVRPVNGRQFLTIRKAATNSGLAKLCRCWCYHQRHAFHKTVLLVITPTMASKEIILCKVIEDLPDPNAL
jgi:hypothetical protein